MMVSFPLSESMARTLATSDHAERLIADKITILLSSKYGWAEDEIEFVRGDPGFQDNVNREWLRHAHAIRYGGKLPKGLSVDCPVPGTRTNTGRWGSGRSVLRLTGH
jgi:hypothetical protein